jgi:outer membrane lipopolysaccharide assembly protein LptE/RlpB
MRLALVCCLLLSACGYHLVGQGDASVIPEDVTSASLSTNAGQVGKILLGELQQLWLQNEHLPPLQDDKGVKAHHITMRIEQANTAFVPVAFDSAGLAIQYQLRVSAVLNMYQKDTLIWSSGAVSSSADVFGDASALANNPASIEAEKETLSEQLYQKWAQEALARLQSGF